jgi:hypothetical protein
MTANLLYYHQKRGKLIAANLGLTIDSGTLAADIGKLESISNKLSIFQ